MKKIIVLSVLMLLLMGVNSFATDTRVLTMGENGTILLDDANIWLYPSRINHYPDILTAEISSPEYIGPSKAGMAGDQPISKVGINWKFGGDKPWILGTYLHNNAQYMDEDNMLEMITPSPDIVPYHGPRWDDTEMSFSNKRVDLFWGKMFGENAFGIHIGYVHSSYKNEDLEPNDGITLSERGFGKYDISLGLTMMENKLDLAAGIEILTFTYKNTYYSPDTGNYDYYKPEGNNTMFLRGRYFHEYSPTYTFVPHAEVKMGKYEYSQNDWNVADEAEEMDYSYKYNLTAFELGVGMHYTPATKVLAVIDFGFMYAGMKEEYTNTIYDSDTSYTEMDEEKWTYTMLPYFKVGLEAEVFSWMDLRLGATSYWTKYSNEETLYNDSLTTTYTEKYPYNHTYLGLGFHWNRLHVDTYVDPELFLDGFYFLSGTDSKVAGMNFQISAKYDMF